MASPLSFDPFLALGLPRDAAPTVIKSRYRQLARRYHPNRHSGTDEQKAALAEHFIDINQAYNHLKVADKRRRALELLQLADEQDELLHRMSDLLDEVARVEESQAHVQTAEADGHLSSDADEDHLPQMTALRRRTTFDKATPSSPRTADGAEKSSFPSRMASLHRRAKLRDSSFQPPTLASKDKSEKDADYFSVRRKKLEKLRRKEMAAFFHFRDAVVDKIEAEHEAERRRDAYERATWKREYFERAPRETTERMRSFQHFLGAVRAFGMQPPSRRSRSTTSSSYSEQILSTDAVPEQSQYLNADNAMSPSKARPLNRRGWSSDISGDQTSSDDNSSGHSSPKPSSSWTWHRKHGRNTSLEAFLTPSGLRSERPTATKPPEHQPFKMIVRQPTGFSDSLNGRDSACEFAITPPRSPTSPSSSRLSNSFTLVSRQAPQRASEQPRPPPITVGTANGLRGAANALGIASVKSSADFLVKQLRPPDFDRIRADHVHELNYAEKCWMLRADTDVEAEPSDLIARLKELDSDVANRFMVKPDAKEAFRFRLIYDHGDVTKDQHQSYIALSYRRRIHVEEKEGSFALPLEPELFQAVWDERSSPKEGVWIDQLCIDQHSRAETTISMSAMDMVYRSARLVVVVLDDVELSASEGDTFEKHMVDFAALQHIVASKRFRGKQPPFLDTHEGMYNVINRLLSSAWFQRAWCRHEMRLGRHHVFLVPCKRPGTLTGRSVIRLTSQCLTHLLALAIETPFDKPIESVKPALHAFFRDRSQVAADEESMRLHHGNFTSVVAEVFTMEAGGDPRIPARQRASDARKDKISIVLNTMECGLSLTAAMREPGVSLSTSDCHYMLLMLALAARDPGALCSVGPPMRLLSSGAAMSPSATSTWLFEPTVVDSGLNNHRTLNRIAEDAHISTGMVIGEHYVELDLKILEPGHVQRATDDNETLELAQKFIRSCEKRNFGRNRKRYLVHDLAATRHFGDMQEVYVHTLACVLQCGPDWMGEVCHRYGVSRWRQDLQSAFDLLIALKNTSGRWPESAWSGQAAGFIVDFVNFLVIRGMPQRQVLHHEEWRPVWVLTGNGGKVITFVPPQDATPVLPMALLDPDYIHLARLWLVQPREGPHQALHGEAATTTWTLLGKSVLFGDDKAAQQLHQVGGEILSRQKVFGREDPEIQRLLRERSLYF